MSSGTARGLEVFDLIERQTRSEADRTANRVATEEYLVRHALKSFLHQLSLTKHGNDFVVKSGILLAAYEIRRPTKTSTPKPYPPTFHHLTSKTSSST